MGKALFWVAIFVGSLLVTRLLARKAAQRGLEAGQSGTNSPFASRKPAALRSSEQMVRCEQCGVHLPVSEAIRTGSHIWCSQEHAKLGVKSGT